VPQAARCALLRSVSIQVSACRLNCSPITAPASSNPHSSTAIGDSRWRVSLPSAPVTRMSISGSV